MARYWLTPGGSLDEGEGYAEAARREPREETGMVGVEPGPWAALCEPALRWGGESIRAHDRFCLARVDRTGVDLANRSDQERAVYRGHRWWDEDELRTSGERVVPPGLVDPLVRIVAGDVPASPVWLG